MEFRDAVKYLRKELGLTQNELASALNINYATIGRWELGKNVPNRSTTVALLEFAKTKSASEYCIKTLEDSIKSVAKEKIDASEDGLFSVEHASLSQIIDEAAFPIYVCDMETDELLYTNRRAAEIIGKDAYTAGKKCYEAIMHRDSSCPFCHKREFVEDSFKMYTVKRECDGKTYHVQGKLVQWNGRKAHVRYIRENDADKNDLIENRDFISVLTEDDVAEKSKRQAISAEQYLNAVMNNINNGIAASIIQDDISFIKDKNGRYIACSLSAVNALGLDSEKDIIGKTSAEAFGSENVEQYDREDRQIYATGKPLLDKMIKLTFRNGGAGVFNTSKYPLFDGDGKVVGIYTLYRDVTEKTATEFELNTLLRVIPSGVMKYSADEKAEFAYINHSLIDSLGYTEEQFRTKFHNSFREMVWHEDRAETEKRIITQEVDGKTGRFDFRVEAADGQLRWFHDEGVNVTDENGKAWYYVTLNDITAQKTSEENLRLAEEEYRLATRHSGHTIGRYDIKARTLTITEDAATRLELPECIPNVPYGRVKLGKISEETSAEYIKFYEKIIAGEKECTVTFQKLLSGEWRWITEHATTIFDEAGNPVSAIVSYKDVTEEQEKEIAYKKWQQSIDERDPKTYTLFRCNLNRNASYDIREGSLLTFKLNDTTKTFNDRIAAYAEQYVCEEDRGRYIAFLNSDTMLAEYYRNHRRDGIEYREMTSDGGTRWLKLSVDLVESPNSHDIEAFLLYESIDEQKKAELETHHMAETDPLTGLLNRKAFAEKVNELILKSNSDTQHAFFMLDIDGFKLLNDTFGHSAGDEELVEVSRKLQNLLRKEDVLGRLGGDEFVMFLSNIANKADIGKKAEQICKCLVKKYSADINVTASLGIALYPRDGTDSHSLYEKADTALYAAKENGRNTFRFYTQSLPEKSVGADAHEMDIHLTEQLKKRRMLIIDDNKIDRILLKNIFDKDYLVEVAADGMTALSRMRYHGSALSVILLDLNMKGLGGFDILNKARNSPETHGVPIIVVGGENDAETCMRAIRSGAVDFVTKPVQPELIRLRTDIAVSRAENERFRIQNSLLR